MFGLKHKTNNDQHQANEARDYFREMEDQRNAVFFMLLTDAVRR